MKKIIDGKRYDTHTAEVIAEWDNGYNRSDFKWCEQTLYRTQKGNWFIAGEGGPLSQYAQPAGKNVTGGDAIEPLTPAQAKQWLEEKDFPTELERYFGDQIEDA